MKLPIPMLPPGEPDPKWLRRLLIIQWASLALVFLLSVFTLSAWLFPQFAESFRVFAAHSSPVVALIEFFCVLSLATSELANSSLVVSLGRGLALVSTLLAMMSLALVVQPFTIPSFFRDLGLEPSLDDARSPQSAAAFLFLSVIILLVRNESAHWLKASDILVFCLCFSTLVLVSQDLFGKLNLFGLTPADLIAPQVLCPLALLTLVVAFRQAPFGVFSIFLGCGIGSRIARSFAPILLLWPFVREIGEAQIAFRGLVPAHFSTSIVTSLAVTFSLLLLLSIVWRVNDMEKEIHDLTLRDDLTGLYNMRGFFLLAEQTLRLARRAKLPFSVLFLDLDGLKQINDRLGHNVGSAYLVETAAVLDANFRNSDVKGRFGGDEFVVAGQFSVVGIDLAAQRLRSAATDRNEKAERPFPLSFSIGHVTTEYYSTETLKELVTRADNLMYEDKRRKKKARI